jgi:microcystin-dependent protein
MLTMTAANTAPSGWMLCNGSAISRTTYADLFAAIGTTYGVGDSSTTFNIPDLRGRVAVGSDSSQTEFDALGETGGAKTVTLVEANLPSHAHTITHNHTVTVDSTGAVNTLENNANHTHTTNGDGAHNHPTRRVTGNNPSGSNVNFMTEGNTGTLAGGTTAGGGNHNHALNNQSANHTHRYDHSHTGSAGASSAANTGNVGSGTALSVQNPYFVLNYIIKT